MDKNCGNDKQMFCATLLSWHQTHASSIKIMFHDNQSKMVVSADLTYCLLGVAAFVLVGAKREEVIVMRKLIGRHWICNQGKKKFHVHQCQAQIEI